MQHHCKYTNSPERSQLTIKKKEVFFINNTLTFKYLIIEVGSQAVSLVCGQQTGGFKDCSFNHHYETKHPEIQEVFRRSF